MTTQLLTKSDPYVWYETYVTIELVYRAKFKFGSRVSYSLAVQIRAKKEHYLIFIYILMKINHFLKSSAN
jgi:hypothetical protein